jgi:hypothetical protein
LERYESIGDAYTAKARERVEQNVGKAIAYAEQDASTNLELGEPISSWYKWWGIFAVGPIQNITYPPFLPHKIIAGGELAFFHSPALTS